MYDGVKDGMYSIKVYKKKCYIIGGKGLNIVFEYQLYLMLYVFIELDVLIFYGTFLLNVH